MQCKDWVTKADIKILGEFSAVMQDVRAAKGLLLCSAGFCKSNRKYARARSIELLTIQDIKSPKWSVAIHSQIHDHVNEMTMPLHVKLENVNLSLEDGFVEMATDMSSEFSGLNIEVEEWSGTFNVN